jgi:hypothetical protein
MAESHLPVAAPDLDGGAPAREGVHFGEKEQALSDELRPESGRKSMNGREQPPRRLRLFSTLQTVPR